MSVNTDETSSLLADNRNSQNYTSAVATYEYEQSLGKDEGPDPHNWEFAGWGTVSKLKFATPEASVHVKDFGSETSDVDHSQKIKKEQAPHSHQTLGQLRATAIAGNDITSSCLYVAGIAAQSSRKYTPFSLLIVVIILYFFRSIYTEVGEALPLNGGSYNVLLNSTTKLMAAVAACLSIISYVATAVVSASSAVAYLGNLYEPLGAEWMVIVVLGIFAILNLVGISESANVASAIFVLHILTLILLVVVSAIKMFSDLSILEANWNEPTVINIPADIYFGYATALLGVTGFETSSNYIEEQKPGVFPKTLRNMWILVAIFNPILSLLSLGTLPMSEILQNQASLLAWMAKRAGGDWLNYIVCIDAMLVLSGAVLTAYVGVTGLVKRMSLDRCMPQVLLSENRLRKTNHWIIIGFFCITSSLYLIVNGNILYLGGVYCIAFLGVMSLFGIGNMLLKYKRSRLPRNTRASWPAVIIGVLAIWAGLIGNVVYNLTYLAYFALYFSVTMTIVLLMFGRIRLLRILLYFLSKSSIGKRYFENWIQRKVKTINSQPLVFFAKTEELPVLAKAIEYVRDNESSSWLKIVHVYKTEDSVPPNIETYTKLLDKMYPKLRIDLLLVQGTFGPALVDRLSMELNIPKNYMFITCPSDKFPHKMSEFGGIRLITH